MGENINKEIQKIVNDNIKLIYKPTREFYNKNEMIRVKYEFDELLSVATLALHKAAEKFDKSKGFEFSTYAVPLIKYSLIEFTRKDKWYYNRTNIKGVERFEVVDRISTSSKLKDVGRAGDKDLTIEDSLQDQEDFYKDTEDKSAIEYLLNTCVDREKEILIGYFYDEKSQMQLAREFETSQSFISLVIKRNLKRFKKILKEEGFNYVG